MARWSPHGFSQILLGLVAPKTWHGVQGWCAGIVFAFALLVQPVVDLPVALNPKPYFVVLYCNFRSLAFLGLLGFLIRQLKV